MSWTASSMLPFSQGWVFSVEGGVDDAPGRGNPIPIEGAILPKG